MYQRILHNANLKVYFGAVKTGYKEGSEDDLNSLSSDKDIVLMEPQSLGMSMLGTSSCR